jgi:hypothetical protein
MDNTCEHEGFNMNKERGGFTATGLGGGKQTLSLHLKEKKTGKEWIYVPLINCH